MDENGRPISDWLVLEDEFKGPEFDDRRVEPDSRYEYSVIPFFQEFADRIHRHGAALMIQLTHMGRRTKWDTENWLPTLSASPRREPAHRSIPKEMEDFDFKRIIADYADVFTNTPLVMLGVGSDNDPRMVDVMGYALTRGTGWRVDCWGDYGIFSKNWDHHRTLYPNFMNNARRVYPKFDEVWKHAPIKTTLLREGGPPRTTLALAVRNEPGTLLAVLEVFARHGLNMSKLESRPSRERAWEYVFWVDLDADGRGPQTHAALAELEAVTTMLRVLGSYARGQGG